MEKIEGDNKETDLSFSHKTSFVIGFSALIIALFPYKDVAQSFNISVFGFILSLYNLIGIFLLILFCSIYLYGLNYIRYDFPSLLNIKWLRRLELLAHFFYMLAFIFPLAVIFLFGISSFAEIVPKLIPYADMILNIVTVIISTSVFAVSYYSYRNKEKDLLQELNSQSKILSTLWSNQNTKKIDVINSYEFILLTLERLLVPYIGLAVQRIMPSKIVRLALNKELISSEDAALIEDLKGIRNQVAHNKFPEDVEIEENLLLRVNNLLDKLKNLKNKINGTNF